MMKRKERSLRLKKLDALYITHNLPDCLIVYFCVCFTFLRIVTDLCGLASVGDVYVTAAVFTAVTGPVMRLWAGRVVRRLDLDRLI